MVGWRDIKTRVLAKVHDTFECPAVYLPAMATAVATRVNVRVHAKISARENEFVWPGASAISEATPKLVFRSDQLSMVRQNAVVILGPTEMYRLGASEPERFGYYKVECVQLSSDECAVLIAQIGPVSGLTWEGVLP